MSSELFSATGISAGYANVQVLWGASLAVGEGETVVLLGPNGAGKTTLIKTFMGLIEAWQGEIRFDGQSIAHLRTERRVRAGIAYMSEMGCFPGLSVEENIRIGSQFISAAARRQRMAELYASFPVLAERRASMASALSGGQRKLLGIAKALAGNPKLLMMDEPSAGLSPIFVKEVMQQLERFRAQGLSLLIAEQHVKFLELADRAYTLEAGRIGFSGSSRALREDTALRETYFGLR